MSARRRIAQAAHDAGEPWAAAALAQLEAEADYERATRHSGDPDDFDPPHTSWTSADGACRSFHRDPGAPRPPWERTDDEEANR